MEKRPILSAATLAALDTLALAWGGLCFLINSFLKRV